MGSVRAITDGAGTVVEQNDYYPFGGRHSYGNTYLQTTANRYKFNGKEEQTIGNLGLLDYGARMYDPAIGRWTAQDPLSEKYYSFSAYNYCVNNPVMFVDLDGRVVRIYIESGIIGHTFVTTGEGSNTKVYTYGRYGEFYPISSGITIGKYTPTGEGILSIGSGEQAADCLQKIYQKDNISIFEIPSADEAKVDSYFNELFNNGKTKENSSSKLDQKVIDDYSLLTNNCTTISIDAVNYADGDIPTSSIIIMPYGHIQTMNINIIKPSQLNNQLNIDQNVNKVDDPYGFLINFVNNLNTANQ